MTEAMKAKDCHNCIYGSYKTFEEPCFTCGILHKHFSPKYERIPIPETDVDKLYSSAIENLRRYSSEKKKEDKNMDMATNTFGNLNLDVKIPDYYMNVISEKLPDATTTGYKYHDPAAHGADTDGDSIGKITADTSRKVPLDHTFSVKQITPLRIWFNAHDGMKFTTVEWLDGTKTTVSTLDDICAGDYSGFTAALAKKIFGSAMAISLMNDAIDKAAEPARQREELRQNEKIMRRAQREAALRRHEKRVAEYMEELRVKREAELRLEEQMHKKFDELASKAAENEPDLTDKTEENA